MTPGSWVAAVIAVIGVVMTIVAAAQDRVGYCWLFLGIAVVAGLECCWLILWNARQP